MPTNQVTRLSLSLLLPLLISGLFIGIFNADRTHAAPSTVITVTNTNDSGAGSLRQAILDANAGDRIEFGVSGTILLTSELVINKDLTISGTMPITVSGNNATRVFNVTTGDVTFDSLQIINGIVTTGDCGLFSDWCGGGIAIQNSSVAVTVTNSTLSGNLAGTGGAIGNYLGSLIVINSVLADNSADNNGGGIFNHYGTVTITNSALFDNWAGTGGGITNHFGTVTVTNSAFSDNHGGQGGAIYSYTDIGNCTDPARTTITNSTLSGNSSYSGGGIFNFTGVIEITHSTITNNTAGDTGSGVWSQNGNGTCTRVGNSIIAGNIGNGDVAAIYTNHRYSSLGYNLIGTAGPNVDFTQEFNAMGDMTNTLPELDPLANNGGSTLTHAPLPSSPAIDAGDPAYAGGGYDQRGVGYDRVVNGRLDIGAFETESGAHLLTVILDGTGSGSVVSNPIGIDCGTVCDALYFEGTVVTLTATAATGSTFSGWSGACGGTNTCMVTMDAAKSVTATFTLNTYPLTVALAGTGSGSVTSDPIGINCGTDCSETYDYETVVTLSATATTDSTFTGWSGACSGTNTCVVTMDAAKSVIATFTLNSYPLTVALDGTGSGSVTSDPVGINCGADCSETYDYGTVVTLTATTMAGSTFTGWGGACGGTNTCIVTMDAAKSVTATFTLNSYPLTVTLEGTGSGSVTSNPIGIDCGIDCSEIYDYGTVVTLTVTTTPGSTFTGWSGPCDGANTCVVMMDAVKNVTATFTLNTYEIFLPAILNN